MNLAGKKYYCVRHTPIMQVNVPLYYKKCSEYSEKFLYIETNEKISLKQIWLIYMFFFCGISLSNTTPQRIKTSWCTQWWASIKSLWIFVSVNHITPALFFLSAVYFLSDLWLAIYSVNVFVLTYWNLFVNLTFVNSHFYWQDMKIFF